MSELPTLGPDGTWFARRSAAGKVAAAGEGPRSSTGFDAILGGFALEKSLEKSSTALRVAGEGEAVGGHGSLETTGFAPAQASVSSSTPASDQMLNALLDDARPDGAASPKLAGCPEVDPPELAEPAVALIEVDIAGDQSALAPAIAHHLAAMLDEPEPEPGPAKTSPVMAVRGQGAAPEAGPAAPRISGQEVAAADRRQLSQSGRVGLPSFNITRHETHFRSAFFSVDNGVEAESPLTSEGRSGRIGPGVLSGLRMGVPNSGGSMSAPAAPGRSMGRDAGPLSRPAMMAGMMPGLAQDPGHWPPISRRASPER